MKEQPSIQVTDCSVWVSICKCFPHWYQSKTQFYAYFYPTILFKKLNGLCRSKKLILMLWFIAFLNTYSNPKVRETKKWVLFQAVQLIQSHLLNTQAVPINFSEADLDTDLIMWLSQSSCD